MCTKKRRDAFFAAQEYACGFALYLRNPLHAGLPANAHLDSLHAKPRSREEEQQQDTAWAKGSVGLQANMCLCCLDTELQAKRLR